MLRAVGDVRDASEAPRGAAHRASRQARVRCDWWGNDEAIVDEQGYTCGGTGQAYILRDRTHIDRPWHRIVGRWATPPVHVASRIGAASSFSTFVELCNRHTLLSSWRTAGQTTTPRHAKGSITIQMHL